MEKLIERVKSATQGSTRHTIDWMWACDQISDREHAALYVHFEMQMFDEEKDRAA